MSLVSAPTRRRHQSPAAAVVAVAEGRPSDEVYVLGSVSRQGYQKLFKLLAPGHTVKCLRGSCASHLLSKGVPIANGRPPAGVLQADHDRSPLRETPAE